LAYNVLIKYVTTKDYSFLLLWCLCLAAVARLIIPTATVLSASEVVAPVVVASSAAVLAAVITLAVLKLSSPAAALFACS
jgi:hypothetical protein